jgi:hypothetical protein
LASVKTDPWVSMKLTCCTVSKNEVSVIGSNLWKYRDKGKGMEISFRDWSWQRSDPFNQHLNWNGQVVSLSLPSEIRHPRLHNSHSSRNYRALKVDFNLPEIHKWNLDSETTRVSKSCTMWPLSPAVFEYASW